MRSTAAAVLLLPAALLSYVAGPATADGPTCGGEPATLVGTGRPSQVLTGTPGRDVVVTNGARTVKAGFGDDLVCVDRSEASRRYLVLAGAGSDDVRIASPAGSADPLTDATYRVFLDEEGSADVDRFVGGAGIESVSSEGDDVVDTGPGRSSVSVGSPGETFAGTVVLGAGSDLVLQGPVGPDAVLDSPAGGSTLRLDHDSGASWAIDAGARTVHRDGRPAFGWSGDFTGFSWSADPVSFVGTAADEVLQGARVVRAQLGGGDDRVGFTTGSSPEALDGGPGTDRVDLGDPAFPPTLDLTVDLGRERMVLDDAVLPLLGFEDVYAYASRTARVLGDEGPNRLLVLSCTARLSGLGGDDDLSDQNAPGESACTSPRATLEGGAGDDRLTGGTRGGRLLGGPGADLLSAIGPFRGWGGEGDDRFSASPGDDVVHGQGGDDRMLGRRGDDVLDGGPGRDVARGARGLDTCRAETRLGCERR